MIRKRWLGRTRLVFKATNHFATNFFAIFGWCIFVLVHSVVISQQDWVALLLFYAFKSLTHLWPITCTIAPGSLCVLPAWVICHMPFWPCRQWGDPSAFEWCREVPLKLLVLRSGVMTSNRVPEAPFCTPNPRGGCWVIQGSDVDTCCAPGQDQRHTADARSSALPASAVHSSPW